MWIVYLAVGLFIIFTLHRKWRMQDRRHGLAAEHEQREVAGLGDVSPASLHPKIEPYKCIGSGACIAACPEKNVLGIVGGHAQLINPLACVGHGACAASCPVQAIDLVFGTETKGIELPKITPEYETSKPGVYVIGELGGMGLIRNAVKQGTEVAEYIAGSGRRGQGQTLDAVVVGAGPAGIAATAGLLTRGMRVALLEQSELGGTIAHYPRAKVAMTGSFEIPGYGKVKRKTMDKDELIALWNELHRKLQLPLHTGVQVKSLEPAQGGWSVRADGGAFTAANVVLALGRRGSPRALGVPGEERSKVVYSLAEPEAFAGQHVMVVGGGNSAVEAALSLSDAGCCASVAISYRRGAFARTRGSNRTRIDEYLQQGRVKGLLETEVVKIDDQSVELKAKDGRHYTERNDALIVQVGGTAPTGLLTACGVELVTKYGER